jgi:regulator of sirC expression with transglutaminase-like and TPR domain
VPTARFDNSQVYRLDASTPAYEEGRELARAEQWQAAIDAYDAALADNPYSARAYADRARAYLALGEVSQALSDFDAALQQMPTWDALRDERAAAAAQEAHRD